MLASRRSASQNLRTTSKLLYELALSSRFVDAVLKSCSQSRLSRGALSVEGRVKEAILRHSISSRSEETSPRRSLLGGMCSGRC
jgi:hypothetical protein